MTDEVRSLFQDTRTTALEPLPAPTIDLREEVELLENAIARVRESSGGQLTDFTPGSPTRALLSGHALVGARIAHYADAIAGAAAINFLQVAGIQRVAGKAATTTLEFRLTATLNNVFTVAAGFVVRAGGVSFTTTQSLQILPGTLTGQVLAECAQTGTVGNVLAGTINNPLRGVAFLKSVYNPLAATNGIDAETDQEVVQRGFSSLRRRNLITTDDYEVFVRDLVGTGTVVKAYGGVNLLGEEIEQPSVIVAACKTSGELLTDAQKVALQSALAARGHITVDHVIADIVPLVVSVWVRIGLPVGVNAEQTRDDIAAKIIEFLTPHERWVDARLEQNELEYQVRSLVPGAIGFGVYFGEEGANLDASLIVTNDYQTLRVENIIVETTQGVIVETSAYGPGDPD